MVTRQYNDIRLAESEGGCQALETEANSFHPAPRDLSRCLSCPGGFSCVKCQSGFYDPQEKRPRPVLVPLTYEVTEKKRYQKKKRRNRFYMRCVLGIEIALAAGFIVRAFTLTESDYALGMGLDFGRASMKFFQKMQYDYGRSIPRYVITHHAFGSARLDRHVICFGTPKLDVLAMDKHWHKVYGSKLTGMEKVYSPRGLAFYLCQYLVADGDKFVKATMSPQWVFPKWWQYNLAYQKAYGVFPPLERFVELLRLPGDVRKAEVDSLLYIWSASDSEVKTWKKQNIAL